eukprot:COSAG01_NODE_6510_length_3627_cov_196.897109_1_plen_235_part_00
MHSTLLFILKLRSAADGELELGRIHQLGQHRLKEVLVTNWQVLSRLGVECQPQARPFPLADADVPALDDGLRQSVDDVKPKLRASPLSCMHWGWRSRQLCTTQRKMPAHVRDSCIVRHTAWQIALATTVLKSHVIMRQCRGQVHLRRQPQQPVLCHVQGNRSELMQAWEVAERFERAARTTLELQSSSEIHSRPSHEGQTAAHASPRTHRSTSSPSARRRPSGPALGHSRPWSR